MGSPFGTASAAAAAGLLGPGSPINAAAALSWLSSPSLIPATAPLPPQAKSNLYKVRRAAALPARPLAGWAGRLGPPPPPPALLECDRACAAAQASLPAPPSCRPRCAAPGATQGPAATAGKQQPAPGRGSAGSHACVRVVGIGGWVAPARCPLPRRRRAQAWQQPPRRPRWMPRQSSSRPFHAAPPACSKCQFAHGPAELRQVPRHPKYKARPRPPSPSAPAVPPCRSLAATSKRCRAALAGRGEVAWRACAPLLHTPAARIAAGPSSHCPPASPPGFVTPLNPPPACPRRRRSAARSSRRAHVSVGAAAARRLATCALFLLRSLLLHRRSERAQRTALTPPPPPLRRWPLQVPMVPAAGSCT
jgi:hypothetical protein